MANPVRLTDSELVILDGQVNEKVQKEVNDAKVRLGFVARVSNEVPMKYRDLVGKVVEEATVNGQLVFQRRAFRCCPVCGKSAGYAKYKSIMGEPPRYKKYDNRRCISCNWVGHDGQNCCLCLPSSGVSTPVSAQAATPRACRLVEAVPSRLARVLLSWRWAM